MKTIDGKLDLIQTYMNVEKWLSILGTWSGPSWTNIMTLKTILLSIRSLMSDFPITNELGLKIHLETLRKI